MDIESINQQTSAFTDALRHLCREHGVVLVADEGVAVYPRVVTESWPDGELVAEDPIARLELVGMTAKGLERHRTEQARVAALSQEQREELRRLYLAIGRNLSLRDDVDASTLRQQIYDVAWGLKGSSSEGTDQLIARGRNLLGER